MEKADFPNFLSLLGPWKPPKQVTRDMDPCQLLVKTTPSLRRGVHRGREMGQLPLNPSELRRPHRASAQGVDGQPG